jgi:hypothetical protein
MASSSVFFVPALERVFANILHSKDMFKKKVAKLGIFCRLLCLTNPALERLFEILVYSKDMSNKQLKNMSLSYFFLSYLCGKTFGLRLVVDIALVIPS